MNNAETFPVDIAAERDWLLAEKAARGYSWPQISALVGVPNGTLSLFGGDTYRGDQAKIARSVFRYRQTLESQTERLIGIAQDPGFFETPTSRRLRGLLIIAHMGRITLGATGPGTGKTVMLREYAASTSNVWRVTVWRGDKTLSALIGKVLRAVGESPKYGRTSDLSRQVADKVRGRRGLIAFDEANNLTTEQLEEIRAWHDEDDGPGIALFGNEELLMRIESAGKQDAYGRLNSRIAQRLIQTRPEPEDVACFCDAWAITEAAQRELLTKIALMPGAGGLRECRQIVEQASMLAADEDRALTLVDLRDAQANRATRLVRAA